MIFGDCQHGAAITVSASDFRLLLAIGNNSSRLSAERIAATQLTRDEIDSFVSFLRNVPRKGYERAHVIARQHDSKAHESTVGSTQLKSENPEMQCYFDYSLMANSVEKNSK